MGPTAVNCRSSESTKGQRKDRCRAHRGRCWTHVSTEEEQAQRQTDGTGDQRDTTTDPVDDKEPKEQGADKLDGPVDTSGEQRVLGADETELLKDDGRVVVDGLDTGEGLEEDQTHTEEQPLSVGVHDKELLGDPEQTRVSTESSLGLDSLGDLVEFKRQVRVVLGDSTDSDEVLDGQLSLVDHQQPPRRLGHEKGTDEQKGGGEELDEDGELPLEPVGLHGGLDGVVDPEPGEGTDLDEDVEEPDETSSDRGRGELGEVDGDDQGQETDGETTKESTEYKDGLSRVERQPCVDDRMAARHRDLRPNRWRKSERKRSR